MILAGGGTFPLRKSFLQNSHATITQINRNANIFLSPIFSTIRISIGFRQKQKAHSNPNLFLPASTQQQLLSIFSTHQHLVDLANFSPHPTFFPGVVPPAWIYDSPSPHTFVRHIRQAYSTLLQFLLFCNRITPLEFAACAYCMCHGVNVACLEYCCLPALPLPLLNLPKKKLKKPTMPTLSINQFSSNLEAPKQASPSTPLQTLLGINLSGLLLQLLIGNVIPVMKKSLLKF